jgi:hypothetical protein
MPKQLLVITGGIGLGDTDVDITGRVEVLVLPAVW